MSRNPNQSICHVLLALLAMALSSTTAAAATLLQARDANVRPALVQSVVPGANNLQLTIDTAAGQLDLLLKPHTDLVASAASFVPAIGRGELRVYRGRVKGDADSWVRLTRIGDVWIGAVRTGGQLWLLDPARFHPDVAARTSGSATGTLVFSMADIDGLRIFDHGAAWPQWSGPSTSIPRALSGHGFAPTTPAASTIYHLGVTLVLDTEFQSHYGIDASFVAIAILNIADGFYSAQVNTNLYLHHLRLLTSNGAMTSTDSDALLDAFVQYVQSSSLPFNGVAHLLSGKNFNGNTVGLAYVSALCNKPYGSGVEQVTFSAAASGAIFAHELGHNYGAHHDGDNNACPASGYILASILNLGIPATEFSSCSLDYFADYIVQHHPQCLLQAPDAIFLNGFD